MLSLFYAYTLESRNNTLMRVEFSDVHDYRKTQIQILSDSRWLHKSDTTFLPNILNNESFCA